MQSSISPSPNWFKPSTSTWGDPRLAEFLSLCCGAALREAAGPRAQQAPALVRQSTCAGVCACVCAPAHASTAGSGELCPAALPGPTMARLRGRARSCSYVGTFGEGRGCAITVVLSEASQLGSR